MKPRWFFTSLLGALALWTVYKTFVDPAAYSRLNVIILTVESAQARVISAGITPHIWAAAQSGTRFSTHRAISAWTAPNIITILTGLSPYAQGVHTRGHSVATDWQLPLEDLARAGWQVGGLQSFMAINLFRHLGLTLEPTNDPRPWMARHAARNRPFVLWHHYLNTHLPYNPSPPFRPDLKKFKQLGDPALDTRLKAVMSLPAIIAGSVPFKPTDQAAIRALYLGGFKEFDSWFAAFWQFLDRSGLRKNTIVVLTADHGEEILERGLVGHASTTRRGHLHEEIAHVPLIVWLPDRLKKKIKPQAHIKAPNDHLDIMPTIMALLGKTPTRPLQGHNLYKLPNQKSWSAMSSGAGFAEPDPSNITRFIYARLEHPWKLHLETMRGKIVQQKLYNLEIDPEERTDLSQSQPEITQRLKERILAALKTQQPPTPPQFSNIAGVRPRWVFPKVSRTYSYDDLRGEFRLEWTGDLKKNYVIHYIAGEGALRVEGRLDVQGTAKKFKAITRRYWNTWIVPYRTFKIRVGVTGQKNNQNNMWSEWLELEATP